MEYKQAEILRGYIEHLQDEAFERGFKMAIEQGQRHGHWINTGIDGYCSACGCDIPMFMEDWDWKYCETNYCPNCGAKMDEEVQDE